MMIEVGRKVVYVDHERKEHDAMVIHSEESSVNLVYINRLATDSWGYERKLAHSVSPYKKGMGGNYYYAAKVKKEG